MKEKLVDFLVQDGIQSLVAVAVVGTIIFLSVTSAQVPDLLDTLAKIIVPFYFGTKVGAMAVKANLARKD